MTEHRHGGPGHGGPGPLPTGPDAAREFWEARYSGQERVWSGRANPRLVEVVAGLTPGAALDIGCGEGGDTVWLAQQGWHVTAVDVAQAALDRVLEHAETEGVADRVRTERHDLTKTFPAGAYDLVSAQFLQSPLELPRSVVLGRAAAAVAQQGLLLVVEHGSSPSWGWNPDMVFPSPEQVYDEIGLDPSRWSVERLGSADREATGPNGEVGMLTDTIVAVRRTAPA